MKNRYAIEQADEGTSAPVEGEASFVPAPYDFDATGHLTPEEIVAYRAGSLEEEATGRARDHLDGCGRCMDLLLIGGEAPDPEPGVLDFEKEMVWARLKAATAEDEADLVHRQAQSARRKRWQERLGVAAAVLAVLVPLGGFSYRQSTVIADQGTALADLTTPQINVSIHDVLENGHRSPDPDTLAESDAMVFEIPAGTEFFTVVFPVGRSDGVGYRVELFDGDAQLIWTGDGLEVDEFGYATLGLSRRFLAEGSYRIRVHDRAQDQEPIADHSIAIRYLG